MYNKGINCFNNKWGNIMDIFVVILILLLVIICFIWIKYEERKELIKKIEEDNTKDYTSGIELEKIDINGIDYLFATYKIYEENKKKSIEELFRPGKIIIWQDVKWEVISTLESSVEENPNKSSIEKIINYYYVKVRYISKYESKEKCINNYGVITKINGSIINYSNISISNDLDNEILFELIDEFLRLQNNNGEILDLKKELKLLRYEIKNDELDKDNLSSTIDKLKNIASTAVPFATLANQIIGILEKLLM